MAETNPRLVIAGMACSSVAALVRQAKDAGIDVVVQDQPSPVPLPPPVVTEVQIKKQDDEAIYWKRERHKDEPWRQGRKDKLYR